MDKLTHNEIVKNLPEISGTVYEWLNTKGLYAEPGYTDVTVSEISSGTGYTVEQVKGAISHLHSVKLTFSEDWDTGHGSANVEYFIDTYLHDERIDGLTIEEYCAGLQKVTALADGIDYDSRQGIGIDEQ